MSVYRYRQRLIGAIFKQEFDDVDMVFLSGDIERCESILHTQPSYMRPMKPETKYCITIRSQHSQECNDPCRQCFCRWLTAKNSMNGKTGGQQQHRPRGSDAWTIRCLKHGLCCGALQRQKKTQCSVRTQQDRHRLFVTRDLDL